jgi:molybdenum cofactor cytidylyltransferase
MPEAIPGGPPRLAAIILAAGASSRMGRAKALLELEGRSLVARAADAAAASGARPIVVVLGADADRIRAHLAGLPVHVAQNPHWASGMASSIRTGLAAALALDPDVDAVLIALCDQPALSADIIARLAGLHRATGRMAAARYGGRHGAPAVFGRAHFPALSALHGEEGARALLNREPEAVAGIDLPEMAVDLDTPMDVEAWSARGR